MEVKLFPKWLFCALLFLIVVHVSAPVLEVLVAKSDEHGQQNQSNVNRHLLLSIIKYSITMDSIFQVKINENKLHRILSEFNKQQTRLATQLQDAFFQIKSNDQGIRKCRKDLEEKMDSVLSSLAAACSNLSEHHQQSLRQVKKSLAQTAESIYLKHSEFEENIVANSKQISSKGSQFNEKITQLTSFIEKTQKKQSEDQGMLQKLSALEKTVNKTAEVTEILQNKNFLYFLQMLVDRETAGASNFRVSQAIKELKNPFVYETNQQRNKRYKDLKRSLQQTHNKLQSMQTEYVGYFHEATQASKQNRDETHMHYAVLSNKIKEIENKLTDQQIMGIQAQCVEKIIYPTEFHIGGGKGRKNKKNSNLNLADFSFNLQSKQNQSGSQESLKQEVIRQQKQLKIKIESIEDQLHSNSSKISKIKEYCRVELEKIAERMKATNYTQFSMQSNSYNNMSTKNMAEFVHQFRNIQEDLEQRLKQKADVSALRKHQEQSHEKNRILSEQIGLKANKEEIRKAFNFIEEKIKQMVTVIASMQNSSRKTAGRKMVVQCLSCDDNFFEESSLANCKLSERANQPNANTDANLRIGSFTLRKGRHKKQQCRRSNIET